MSRGKIGNKFGRDERGVSTAIVAVSLIGIFAATMLSLDMGNMWQTRRRIITGTDSTALAQARAAAIGNNPASCTASWTDTLIGNAGAIVTGSESCVLHPSGGVGYVVVQARKLSETRFGGLLNIGNSEPFSLTAAQYGYITQPKGLRPMAFCEDNAHVRQWLALKSGSITQAQYDALRSTGDVGGADSADADPFLDPPADGKVDYPNYSGTGVVHRMYFTKDNPDECGADAAGNWGWMDFDSGSNSAADQNDWIENGYDGTSSVGDCDPNNATPDETCPGDTGSSGGANNSVLQYLVDHNAVFGIPIFGNVTDTGSTADFEITGFLIVQLRGFQTTGSESTRYFDFEFQDSILSGACCSSTAPNPGAPKGIRICSVDHDGDTSDAHIDSRCHL
jgi:Flp pilus assembly protein TadG